MINTNNIYFKSHFIISHVFFTGIISKKELNECAVILVAIAPFFRAPIMCHFRAFIQWP